MKDYIEKHIQKTKTMYRIKAYYKGKTYYLGSTDDPNKAQAVRETFLEHIKDVPKTERGKFSKSFAMEVGTLKYSHNN